MEGFGVIVEYSQPENKSSENLSCSGVYLGNGFILSHGTIIIDILKSKHGKVLLQEIVRKGSVHCEEEASLIERTFSLSKFKVIFPVENCTRKKEKTKSTQRSSNEDQKFLHSSAASVNQEKKALNRFCISRNSSERLINPGYSSHPASVAMIFTQDGITKSLSAIMPASQGWKFTEDKDENLIAQFERVLLSTFVLLKVSDHIGNHVKQKISLDLIYAVKNILCHTTKVHKGSGVFVESSPFGSLSPSVFLNSLSFGIISNVCGSRDDVMLTDARCIMGSEGAPVFADNKKKKICGIVISPFCWRQGEWLGLTLVASAHSVLTTLTSYLNIDAREENSISDLTKDTNTMLNSNTHFEKISKTSYLTANEDMKILKKGISEGLTTVLDKSVVAVQCGSGWGSGVIVNRSPGIILTCAHVVNSAKDEFVKIVLADGQVLPGQIIFKTSPGRSAIEDANNDYSGMSVWDLSVIQTTSSLPAALPLASKIPQRGSPVVVAGHGIFSPSRLPAPSVSWGIVSKTIYFPVESLHLSRHRQNTKHLNSFIRTDFTIFKKLDDSPRPNSDVSVANTLQPSQQLQPHFEGKYSGKSNVISQLISCCNDDMMVPLLMQTTCSVYAGTSGGPVVSLHPQKGFQVVGIVVCNTQDTASKATFPNINLAIPAPPLMKIIEKYIASGDKNVLNYLDVESAAASQLWALGVVPKSNL